MFLKYLFIIVFCFPLMVMSEENDIQDFPEYDLINGTMLDNTEEVFSAHQPNYIISGAGDLKLQLSFRYRLLKKIPFFFGYTQRMFWDIHKDSKPFHDINFQPELFYRFIIKDRFLKSIDTGVLHYSNGKAEEESRSLNQVYASFNMVDHNNSYVNFVSSIQTFYTFDKEYTNQDYVNYVGYYKIHAGFMNLLDRNGKNIDLGVSLFAGNHLVNFDKGAVEVNLKFSFLKEYLNPDILLQYYHGYAQNLVDYDKEVDHIRVGFMFYL